MFQAPFSFEGRIGRLQYLISVLAYSFLLAMAIILGNAIKSNLAILLAFVPVCWFGLAQGAKRCHDLGRTGFMQLLPFYGIWMLFAAGDSGPNEYGPEPGSEKTASFDF